MTKGPMIGDTPSIHGPTMGVHAWEPVERLDAARVAADLERETGVRLIVEGPCSGGEVGAAYVRWPNEKRSVLKWRPQTMVEQMRAGSLAVVDVLRSVGYPAPATELAAQVGQAVVTVQELLPGSKLDRLDEHQLDQVLALNNLQAGLLAKHRDIPNVSLHLTSDGPGFCLHGPLRWHSRRTAKLESWISEVGAEHPYLLAGDDAMHLDFHPGNLLAVDGEITGVIDWDGAARGDRRLDLVTLRFGTHTYPTPYADPPPSDPTLESHPGVEAKLDEILDGFPPGVLRPLWAHMSLRMTDWAIRHFTEAEVDHWLDLAERRVD